MAPESYADTTPRSPRAHKTLGILSAGLGVARRAGGVKVNEWTWPAVGERSTRVGRVEDAIIGKPAKSTVQVTGWLHVGTRAQAQVTRLGLDCLPDASKRRLKLLLFLTAFVAWVLTTAPHWQWLYHSWTTPCPGCHAIPVQCSRGASRYESVVSSLTQIWTSSSHLYQRSTSPAPCACRCLCSSWTEKPIHRLNIGCAE